jgi:hypothetical protein
MVLAFRHQHHLVKFPLTRYLLICVLLDFINVSGDNVDIKQIAETDRASLFICDLSVFVGKFVFYFQMRFYGKHRYKFCKIL